MPEKDYDVRGDWVKFAATSEVVEKEFGVVFQGPGWYLTDVSGVNPKSLDTLLVIPNDGGGYCCLVFNGRNGYQAFSNVCDLPVYAKNRLCPRCQHLHECFMEELDNIRKVEEQPHPLSVEQAFNQIQRKQNAVDLQNKIGCADCP